MRPSSDSLRPLDLRNLHRPVYQRERERERERERNEGAVALILQLYDTKEATDSYLHRIEGELTVAPRHIDIGSVTIEVEENTCSEQIG